MIRSPCTMGRQAPPAQIRATVSTYRDLPPVSAAPRPDRISAVADSVEDRSTESSASITECHPRKVFLQSLPFGSVVRFRQSIHERKEPFLLALLRLKTGLNQIDKHAVGARLSRLGQRAHTPGDTSRNRHALTNRPLCFSHITMLHHRAPVQHHSSAYLWMSLGEGGRQVRGAPPS